MINVSVAPVYNLSLSRSPALPPYLYRRFKLSRAHGWRLPAQCHNLVLDVRARERVIMSSAHLTKLVRNWGITMLHAFMSCDTVIVKARYRHAQDDRFD
jgi:hypothetical protein